MAHSKNPKNTEANAYRYIPNELESLGWIVKNPARVDYGEVYQQNEALSNKFLKETLDRDMPEAVIKLNENEFWVIEAKREKKDIEKALDEAKNQYAKKINSHKITTAPIISGVAGNDVDGFIVINQYLKDGNWETIKFNDKTKNILLSKEQVKYILKHKTINYKDFPDIPESKYIEVGQDINEILHNNGINKNDRAKFIAGIILSLATENEINLRIEDTTTLVEQVNTLIKQKLREVEKENFFEFLKLQIPASKENHIKYRTAIKLSLMILQTLDIKNSMASGTDILGKFYETFLKYGNGAKEIGIVLTPRHITQFSVEILDIKHNDYILDVACGTAGFLVSAFDYVKRHSTPKQVDKFKKYNIFGIEQDELVLALALVNMIFRGDGRNNMKNGNCFYQNIEQTIIGEEETGLYKDSNNIIEKKKDKNRNEKTYVKQLKKNPRPLITKVLMNPPFALKKSDEKERHFIQHALNQMQQGGILFAIVPISVMNEKEGLQWRKELLQENTLLSVVTFPEDLFQPSASVGTIGVFIKKGISHDFDTQKVYFGRITKDGYKLKKGKRIENSNIENQLTDMKEELKAFMINQNLKFSDEPEFKKICLLNKEDKSLELLPECYIDSKVPSLEEIEKGVEDLIKNCACYIIKNK